MKSHIKNIIAGIAIYAFSSTSISHAAVPKAISEKLDISNSVIQELQPHKAIYDISLKASKTGSQILDVKGKMYYEWVPSCDGWLTNHRFNLNYTYADIGTVSIKSDYATYENFSGNEFNFSSTRKKDSDLIEEFRGKADKTLKEINYTIPDELSFKTSDNMLFPITHTLKLLEQAEKGKKFYTASVFDGSDDTGPYIINAFLGKKSKIKDSSVTIDGENKKDLLSTDAQSIRLAFFPVLENTSEPEYEMTLNLIKNGIVTDMQVEYPDFTVTQSLNAIEAIEWPKCNEE